MLRGKSRLIVMNGKVVNQELNLEVENLKDGDYEVLIMDDEKNKTLPQLKYLFGVVFRRISELLPDHPPVNALYRYFEEMFAPIHVCNLPNFGRYEYFDLKSEKAIEVNKIVEDIVHYVKTEWGIEIESKEDIKKPEAKELWAGAYTEQWRNLTND